MAKTVQVSAPVSRETKILLDREAKATGLKKGRLVETALRYHLRAMHELPADAMVPPRIVLSGESFVHVVERIREPGRPTKALRELLQSDGG